MSGASVKYQVMGECRWMLYHLKLPTVESGEVKVGAVPPDPGLCGNKEPSVKSEGDVGM